MFGLLRFGVWSCSRARPPAIFSPGLLIRMYAIKPMEAGAVAPRLVRHPLDFKLIEVFERRGYIGRLVDDTWLHAY